MDEIKNPNIAPSTNLPTDDSLEPEVDFVKPKITTRPRTTKPLVEGINAPVVVSATENFIKEEKRLTNAEKELINSSPVLQKPMDPKPISQFIPSKKTSNTKIYIAILIALFLTMGVWFGVNFYKKEFIQTSEKDIKKMEEVETVKPLTTSSASVVNISNNEKTELTSSSTPATNNPVSANSQTIKQLKITKTPTGYLNVRSTFSTAGKLVTKVYPGDIFEYKMEKNKWFEIVLTDGKTGWVTGQYTELLQNK